jgi:hypothetical protein
MIRGVYSTYNIKLALAGLITHDEKEPLDDLDKLTIDPHYLYSFFGEHRKVVVLYLKGSFYNKQHLLIVHT